MPLWPFKGNQLDTLAPAELRDKLIETTAAGSRGELRSLCEKYKRQISLNVDVICHLPEGLPTDDGSIDRHFQYLSFAARYLARECSAPELWNRLGGPNASPPVQWTLWIADLPQRMKWLEYEALIDEAKGFIEQSKTLGATTASQHAASLYGRLGELQFHSGHASEALQAFRSAFDLCVESDDVEGQLAYLQNLLEAHCYLDDEFGLQTAERLRELQEKCGAPTADTLNRIERLRAGEPLCRVVCVHDGRELELSEITEFGAGSYKFLFRRNRLPLQKATSLAAQGNDLASSGQFAAALEKYREARDVDPHDPNPVYQSAVCLLELGAYSQARETLEEVERLAPGWFRCRTDRWLALGLERGTVSNVEFQILRKLEDGGLDERQATLLAEQALERFPDFAPFYLIRGDLHRKHGDFEHAVIAYRRGLELVEEPDLESRLLCALAGTLPQKSAERLRLVERALKIDGSLVAQASARLIGLQ